MKIRIVVTGQEAGSVLTFYNRGVACGTVTLPEPADASNLADALRAGGPNVVDLREPDSDASLDHLVASL